MVYQFAMFRAAITNAFMIAALVGMSAQMPAGAATFEILYKPIDDASSSVVFNAGGGIYGTTSSGGSNGWGSVFVLMPPKNGTNTWLKTTIHNFSDPATSPAIPWGDIVRTSAGTLYGTTFEGGANGNGTVYALLPPTAGSSLWRETTLYSFQKSSVEASPNGLIEGPDGALYGISATGGPNIVGFSGGGTAFKLTPPSGAETQWKETFLHSFGTFGSTGGYDGIYPQGRLIMDADGNLYGTTGAGGTGFGNGQELGRGTVFKLAPPKAGSSRWTETVLYSFPGGRAGSFPAAGLVMDRAGNLYGTTSAGGLETGSCARPTCGIVYELSPPATGGTEWIETPLHLFTGLADGGAPTSSLVIGANGVLYGTTSSGGDTTSKPCLRRNFKGGGCGTVFELKPRTSGSGKWQEILLHVFHDQADGAFPATDLTLDESGAIYGMTFRGSANDNGLAFKIVP